MSSGRYFCAGVKVNGNAEQALAQIKSQNYAESYRGQNKPIHLIGLNFNSESRRVDGVVVSGFSTPKPSARNQ